MSGYILYILLGVLCVIFWRARAGRTLDQLFDADDHLHHRVLAIRNNHPKGGTWAEHKRWRAEGSNHG